MRNKGWTIALALLISGMLLLSSSQIQVSYAFDCSGGTSLCECSGGTCEESDSMLCSFFGGECVERVEGGSCQCGKSTF